MDHTWTIVFTTIATILALASIAVGLYFGIHNMQQTKQNVSAISTVKEQQHYSCESESGLCVPDSDGTFTDLENCENNCKPAMKYSYGPNGCYEDPDGDFDSLSDCNSARPKVRFVYPSLPPWRYRHGPWRRFRRRRRRRHHS